VRGGGPQGLWACGLGGGNFHDFGGLARTWVVSGRGVKKGKLAFKRKRKGQARTREIPKTGKEGGGSTGVYRMDYSKKEGVPEVLMQKGNEDMKEPRNTG